MRTIIIGVVAVALGLVAGILLARSQLGPRIEQVAAERDAALRDLRQVGKDAEQIATRVRQLENENRSLEEELGALREKLAAVPQASDVAEAEEQALWQDEPVFPVALDALDAPDTQMTADAAPDDSQDRLPEEERARREAWWREARQGMRGRMDDFFQDEFDATADPEVQERVVQLQDYTTSLMELRQAMRDAQTDEEREALRETMGETFAGLRELTMAQQDYMTRNLAQEYGIKDPARQDAFIESMREMNSTPYFRPERLFGGRGGPGGMRGPGGPGGPGGPRGPRGPGSGRFGPP